MKKYLIKYITGDEYNSYYQNLFIVDTEDEAYLYIRKGNKLYEKWRDYYFKLIENYKSKINQSKTTSKKDEYWKLKDDAYKKLGRIEGSFDYEELEYRTSYDNRIKEFK